MHPIESKSARVGTPPIRLAPPVVAVADHDDRTELAARIDGGSRWRGDRFACNVRRTPTRADAGWVRVVALIAISTTVAVGIAIIGRRTTASDDAEAQARATPEIPGHLRIFFTADTRGYLEPCGCEKGQFGGVARRATYLHATRRPGDLLIDLGNLGPGTRAHDRLRLDYLLESLRLLGYDHLVPGGGDLALGEDFERAVSDRGAPNVICANLYHRQSSRRVFRPFAIHPFPNGTKLAIIGVTSQYQSPAPVFEVRDPVAAVAETLPEVERLADAAIVVGWIEGQVALDIAARFPGVILVAGGKVPGSSGGLLRRGGAPVVLGGDRGQYVTLVELAASGAPMQASHAWLSEVIRDDPGLAALVRRHDEEAKRLGDEFVRTALGVFAAEGRLGSETCRECHPRAYAVWRESKHSHAVEALRSRDRHRDPNCLECHFQDIPAAGEKADDASVGIGCETCHGGGALHVREERARTPRVPLRLLSNSGASHCAKCHNQENSPRFDRESYWANIEHGNE